MTEVVEQTPVVRLSKVVPDGAAEVFVKLEWFIEWLNVAGASPDRELGAGKTVATVAVDTGLKYSAGALFLT